MYWHYSKQDEKDNVEMQEQVLYMFKIFCLFSYAKWVQKIFLCFQLESCATERQCKVQWRAIFTPFFIYFLEKVDSPSLTVRYTNSMTGNCWFARYLNYFFLLQEFVPQAGSALAINPAGKSEDSKDSISTGTAVYDRGVSNPRHERLKSWLWVVKSIGLSRQKHWFAPSAEQE